MAGKTITQMFDEAAKTPVFAEESARIKIQEALLKIQREKHISDEILAKKMKLTPRKVYNLLHGINAFDFQELCLLAYHLGYKVNVTLIP